MSNCLFVKKNVSLQIFSFVAVIAIIYHPIIGLAFFFFFFFYVAVGGSIMMHAQCVSSMVHIRDKDKSSDIGLRDFSGA